MIGLRPVLTYCRKRLIKKMNMLSYENYDILGKQSILVPKIDCLQTLRPFENYL